MCSIDIEYISTDDLVGRLGTPDEHERDSSDGWCLHAPRNKRCLWPDCGPGTTQMNDSISHHEMRQGNHLLERINQVQMLVFEYMDCRDVSTAQTCRDNNGRDAFRH